MTIPCPDALRVDGNHFAMALGSGFKLQSGKWEYLRVCFLSHN